MANPAPRPPRRFFSDDILAGRVSLDAYPLRYVLVTPAPTTVLHGGMHFHPALLPEVDKVLAAVEHLEAHGWELVNLEQYGLVASLRRRSAG
jgi:hypothetical protein